MMKINLTAIFFIFCFSSLAQTSELIGLYGNCYGVYDGYMCQQFQLNSDSTFIFYDLLHLRGWKVSNGKWQVKSDTLILNSKDRDIKYEYKGSSNDDSLIVIIYIDNNPAAYAHFSNGSDQMLNSLGQIKILKQSDEFLIRMLGVNQTTLSFDKNQIAEKEKVVININSESLEHFYFEDTKWLYKDSKIFHTTDSLGKFDKERFFEKVDDKKLTSTIIIKQSHSS